MTFHRIPSVEKQALPLPAGDLAYAAAREVLRKSGSRLVCTNVNNRHRFSIPGYGDVTDNAARRILTSGDLVPDDPGLFADAPPQSWRWAPRSPPRDRGPGSVDLADISNNF